VIALDIELVQGSFVLSAAFEIDSRATALFGPSGGGKTTILDAIAGLRTPRRGAIAVNDRVLFSSADGINLPPHHRHVGYVPQDVALFPHMNVRRNLLYGRHPGVSPDLDRVVSMLEIDRLLDRRVTELSGGERQRVALARALAIEPRALLLDEPLTALDARTRAEATRELADVLRGAEAPAIVVTHDFAEASVLADEIAVLDAGRVVQHGTAAELAGSPASSFVAGFTGASVLPGVAIRRGDGLTEVTLAGGARVVSVDDLTGSVAAVVRPWDVSLADAHAHDDVSAQNRLRATVTAVTPLGTRARVALALPEPLAADVTAEACERLGLRPGAITLATWKATTTRLVPH
jgi:molybdate transport system ATP-binding protein